MAAKYEVQPLMFFYREIYAVSLITHFKRTHLFIDFQLNRCVLISKKPAKAGF